ncbi:APC family permease [Xanthomonas albilineans]|uniref:Putative amino acid-polyamine-organocation (Apc) superfamily transporter protein n=1 Tax=Xanthomonas albilineans (strain GPE PC73 / CFBP 7063) TaxID=380358 RepID=D2UEB6_XANAP|nr:APC family permease [Xanthomonas albilineans]PPU94477.1 APC family permease [Xanthomonas albilineans]QHQ28678.1 putative amino acid-polyamine-organocation (apc) superfamily transporter protein [Xanthomonas albilineans]CBA16444.1 putative amino acid-polyamine-organocation (apc) superfamily transporter protein [Xanthomonas albilineans GPE PC73]
MATQGKFHKRLSLTDLTFIGLGSIFGSGWLFSASHVSAMAGPAGIVSWIAGGVAVLVLGLVYCELGAALPRAGGVVRYPEYSHGALLGWLMGFITLIAFSSLIAIEVEAARQYAAAWFPWLSQAGSTHPSIAGWLLQLALLVAFFLLNYYSVKTFATANNIVSVFKFLVPVLVIVLLMAHFDARNLHVQGFAPFGAAGVEMAISAGGIIFAYLGLTPIVSVASEVRDPQRNIPIALILSVALSTIIYVLLQLAFLGGVPAQHLAQGWGGIDKVFSLPYHDIALALGMGWLAALVICDAMISPSGTGNIYMNATPRVVYGWARSGGFLPVLARVDAASGIPRPALWLSLGLSVFWTLPFPSWETLIQVVSAALVLSYAVAPVTVAALRRSAPDMPRPFRLRGMALLGPLSFIVAALIVYWSTWSTLSWLLGLQIAMFVLYVLYRLPDAAGRMRLWQQVRGVLWLIAFFALVLLVSFLGTFGGTGQIAHPWDTLSVAVIALGCYYWGACTGLPSEALALEEDDGE